MTESAIFFAGGAIFLIGIGFVLAALRHRTPVHPPVPCFDPRQWRFVWNMQDWYTPKGFRMQLIGWEAVSIGCILMIIYWTIAK